MKHSEQQIKQILSRLQNVQGPNHSGNYVSLCPFHEDKQRSFSIHPEKGCNCFNPSCRAANGISFKELASHLGIDTVDARSAKPEIDVTYDYLDENGKLLFQVVRMRPKSFRQRQPGKNGEWVWNLKGARRLLYHLPDLIATPTDQWIFLCEGEKDADRLKSLGLTATTNPQGAGKWLPEYTEMLRGKKVVILPDNDPAGESHLNRIVPALTPVTADIRVLRLPGLPPKGDVSDWLDKGGTVEQLMQLVESASIPDAEAEFSTGEPELFKRTHQYRVSGGELCVVKTSKDSGDYLSPLCSGVPGIIEEIIRDNGIAESREYAVTAVTATGQTLPRAEVPVGEFGSMNWIDKYWGTKMDISPGNTNVQHIRSYMKRQVNGQMQRRIFTHTGWREIDGRQVFLSSSGGLACPGVEVELRDRLAQYRLPDNPHELSPEQSMKTSLSFMEDGFGNKAVMWPLWAAMFASPLTSLIDPAFTLFIHGHTGSFKTVISALAISHFGSFSYTTMPASWEYTANRLGLEMFICKDIPLVIDDWAPGATANAQRDMEQKIAIVLRAQGNKIGKGRMNPDATAKDSYTPRCLVVTSGEQLPNGESNTARTFVLDIEPGDISVPMLNVAQDEAEQYRYAMSHYLLWLSSQWDHVTQYQPVLWREKRDKALEHGLHLRLPASVAWLHTGMETGLDYACEIGAISHNEREEKLDSFWEVLVGLARKQGTRVNEERPSVRFIEAFKALLTQGRLVLIDKCYESLSDISDPETCEPIPRQLKPGESFIGWEDAEFYYLIPKIIYQVISEFYSRSGSPLTFKPTAVWGDLRRMGMIVCAGSSDTPVVKVGKDKTQRVIKLYKKVVQASV